MGKVTIPLASVGHKAELYVELRATLPCAPGLTVDLVQAPPRLLELSVRMGSWAKRGRRWHEDCFGQARDCILEHWGDSPAVAELCALWKRWHLNAMRAGTRAQAEALESTEFQAHFAAAPHRYYELALEFLSERGLNPDRGYHYGQAWLVELLPADVVSRVQELCAELGHPIDVESVDSGN